MVLVLVVGVVVVLVVVEVVLSSMICCGCSISEMVEVVVVAMHII